MPRPSESAACALASFSTDARLTGQQALSPDARFAAMPKFERNGSNEDTINTVAGQPGGIADTT